jgi:hypothetical protein
MTVTVAPLTTAVLSAVEDRFAGTASGVNNAVSRVAGLLAIAIFRIIVAGAFRTGLEERLNDLAVPQAARAAVEAQRDRLAGAEVPSDVDAGTRGEMERAIDGAFVDGFRVIMLIGAGLALASALIAWLLIEGKAPKEAPAPAGGRAASVAPADGD